MKTLRTSIGIWRASVGLWVRHPGLLMFPLLGIGAVLLLAVVLRLVGLGWGHEVGLAALGLLDPEALDLLDRSPRSFGISFLVTMVMLVFNAGLVRAVLQKVEGERAGLRASLAFAVGRLPALAGYATIAMIAAHLFVHMADGREGLQGVLIRLSWQVWALMTFLVLPVIVQEGRSSTRSIRRSSLLFARNWKQIVLGDLYDRFMLAAIVIVLIGLAMHDSAALGGLGRRVIGMAFLGFLLSFVVFRAIHTCVLYRYAVDGKIPGARAARADDGDQDDA